MKPVHFILVVILTYFCATPPHVAAAQAAQRSQQVEDALARGFAMAQRKQWGLAIKYFKKAQQGAPTDPVTLLNLALAYDKAGGRELIAAAWFKAFLAVAPDAKNAAAVQKRIVELDTQSEIQIQKILETITGAIAQLPGNVNKLPYQDIVSQVNALAGNLAAAQQAMPRTGNAAAKIWAPAYIVSAQAKAGNIMQAKQAAQKIEWKRAQIWALAEVAVIQAMKKDFIGASVTASEIKSNRERAWALSRIAALRARAGDAVGAQAVLALIDKRRVTHRAIAEAAVAEGLARTGDSEQAAKVMAGAQSALAKIKDFNERLLATVQIVRAQAALKNFELAAATTATIPEGHHKYAALKAVAEAKGEIGAAESYRWAAFAARAEANPHLGKIDALLKTAKGQAPTDSIAALGKAAGARARLLEAFRRPE